MAHGPTTDLDLESWSFIDPDTQFECGICGCLEFTAPGAEPPSPAVCHTCNRLVMVDLLAGLEAW